MTDARDRLRLATSGMARGYIRTSPRTGVSFRLGPTTLLFLPLIAFVAACKGVLAFFSTPRITTERKLFVLALVAAGVALCVVFAGSHCDPTGACRQTQPQQHLAALGAGLVLLATLVGITGGNPPIVSWKAVLLATLLAGGLLYAFQAADSQVSRDYPAPKTTPAYNPPAPTTPALLESEGYITHSEYRQMMAGHYLHHDPNCVDAIDTSSQHAGDLCLP